MDNWEVKNIFTVSFLLGSLVFLVSLFIHKIVIQYPLLEVGT